MAQHGLSARPLSRKRSRWKAEDLLLRVSGARFYYLKGKLAKLDLALQLYALECLEKKNFELVLPPLMLHKDFYEGVTDLSAFQDALYKIEGEDEYLIATSEHPIIAMHSNSEICEADRSLLGVQATTNGFVMLANKISYSL